MAKVTLPTTFIDLPDMARLGQKALLLWAPVVNNQNGTVTYGIADNDLSIPLVEGVLQVWWEVEDYVLHTTEKQDWVSRDINGTLWYEYIGKLSAASFDISQAKTDAEINDLLQG
jgi:hypothetical protein